MLGELPSPAPEINEETAPFWAATVNGELLLKKCENCKFTFYYPRSHCPDCGSDRTDWIEATGNGQIYSFTIVRNHRGHYKDYTPFVLAYVELEEGPKILTNVICDDFNELNIGDEVSLEYQDDADEFSLPRFRATQGQ